MFSLPPRPSKIFSTSATLLSPIWFLSLFFLSLYSAFDLNLISSSSSLPGVLKSNLRIKNLNTANQTPTKTKPIASCNKYSFQWLPINGIQFNEAISITPPANTPTILNEYITAAMIPAKIAWTINSIGEINKKVNSIGSVTPQNIAVNVIGISNPITCFFFSGFAVE